MGSKVESEWTFESLNPVPFLTILVFTSDVPSSLVHVRENLQDDIGISKKYPNRKSLVA